MRHFGWFSNTMSHGYPTAWTNFWHHKLGLWPCTKVMKELHSVWKSPKKSHSTLRAKRATFTFWVDKSSLKMPKMANLASFWKSKACGHTVLPDRSILISQILVENAKVEKLKCDILDDFRTLYLCVVG